MDLRRGLYWILTLGGMLFLATTTTLGQSLSQQVLQLLSRVNTWTATQTFQDLRLAVSAPSVTTNRFAWDGTTLTFNGTAIAGGGGATTPHNLLSTTHPDTLAAAVARGSIIRGNATPAWAALAIGAAGTVLRSDGTDPSWSTDGSALTALNATQLTSGTVPDARFPATLPAASGVNLTALNASNLGSGTVPTARLGSGAASASTFLRGDQTWAAAGTGTATSVGLSLPAIFSVSGSPVTTSGTLTATLASQNENLIFAGPTVAPAAAPTFRAMVNADLPLSGVSANTYAKVTVNTRGVVTSGVTQITATTDITGIVPVANGGTNLSTAADDVFLVGNGTTWQAKVMPDCYVVNYVASSNTPGCATSLRATSAIHVFGSLTPASDAAISMVGSFIGATDTVGLYGAQSLSVNNGQGGYGAIWSPTITEGSSGTHGLLAGWRFNAPTIVGGAAAVADGASVYIDGQPAIVGANNYSFYVRGGNVRFGNSGTGDHGILANSPGPHTFGGSSLEFDSAIFLTGSFTGSTATNGFRQNQTLTGIANTDLHGLRTMNTFVEAGTGTHGLIANIAVNTASVTGAGATVTNTASLYVQGAMSATVSGSNYSLWVDDGPVRMDPLVTFHSGSYHLDDAYVGASASSHGTKLEAVVQTFNPADSDTAMLIETYQASGANNCQGGSARCAPDLLIQGGANTAAYGANYRVANVYIGPTLRGNDNLFDRVPQLSYRWATDRLMSRGAHLAEYQNPTNLTLRRANSCLIEDSVVTRAGATATVETVIPHRYSTGNSVVMSGAAAAEYNGTFTITVVDYDTFTYTVSGTPASPDEVNARLASEVCDDDVFTDTGEPRGLETGTSIGIIPFSALGCNTATTCSTTDYYGRNAQIMGKTTERVYSGAYGGQLIFQTTANGTMPGQDPTDRWIVNQDGYFEPATANVTAAGHYLGRTGNPLAGAFIGAIIPTKQNITMAATTAALAVDDKTGFVRLDVTAGALELRGIARDGSGFDRYLQICNINATNDLTIVHNSGAAAANEVILLADGANKTLDTLECALFIYDGSTEVWRTNIP